MSRSDMTASDNRILAAMAAGCRATECFSSGDKERSWWAFFVVHPDRRRRNHGTPAFDRLIEAGAIKVGRRVADWDGLSSQRHKLLLLTEVGAERASTVRDFDVDQHFAGKRVWMPTDVHRASAYYAQRDLEKEQILEAMERLGYRIPHPDLDLPF